MEGAGLLARKVVRADGAGPSERGGIVMAGEKSFPWSSWGGRG